MKLRAGLAGTARWIAAFVCLVMAIAGLSTAQTQDLRETGKKLTGQYQDAVVTVKIVLAVNSDGDANEMKSETCGTVVSPEGLTVIPLFAIDPMALAKRLMGPQIAMMMPAVGSQVKDIKLQRGRGAEIPATVVLRDSDLNIAFLRPIEKPKEKVAFLDLAQAAPAQQLDAILTMTRLGSVADRQIALLPGTIQAIVTRPRKYYVPTGGFGGFGVPAFSAEGKLLGIGLLHTSMGGIEDLQSGIFSMNLSHMGILPIILPADELKDIAAQAPEKPEATPTPEPASEDKDEGTTASEPAAKKPAKEQPAKADTPTTGTKAESQKE